MMCGVQFAEELETGTALPTRNKEDALIKNDDAVLNSTHKGNQKSIDR